MSNFFTRLIDESTELEDKIEKLRSFTLTQQFDDLNEANRALLILQREIMNSYFTCLQERIRLNMPVDEA
jgi:vacuolar-type H+-ATPase subunit E/Vma4